MKFINLKNGCEESFIPSPTVLCIGSFDGVHLGHRQLVDALFERYEALNVKHAGLLRGVWFFSSSSYKSASDLYTLEEKLTAFAELGLDLAIVADFDEVKSLSPMEFVNDVLIGQCKCVHALCGKDFRFGVMASGDSEMLFRLMKGEATVLPLLSDGGVIISSTYIRELLQKGDIENANKFLCKRYSISEMVVHGKALGRTLGLPTVNQLSTHKTFLLCDGIYATVCTVDGEHYFGVTNCGTRPTVEDGAKSNIETHIINFNGDCYGKVIKVEFAHRFRNEMKFESLDALKAQIALDVSEAKKYFEIE